MKKCFVRFLLRYYLRITEFIFYSTVAYTASVLFGISSLGLGDIIFVAGLATYVCAFAAFGDSVRSKFKGELK